MRRVMVRGTTGSGKSTLARALAQRLNAEYVEMDAIHHLPHWSERPREETQAIVNEIAARDAWVFDGNYRHALDTHMDKADCVVWLDYAFPIVFGRLLARTVKRGWKKEELWHGNRESLKTAFFSRESILLWSVRTHWSNRRRCKEAVRAFQGKDTKVVRLTSPLQTELWLQSVPDRLQVSSHANGRGVS